MKEAFFYNYPQQCVKVAQKWKGKATAASEASVQTISAVKDVNQYSVVKTVSCNKRECVFRENASKRWTLSWNSLSDSWNFVIDFTRPHRHDWTKLCLNLARDTLMGRGK